MQYRSYVGVRLILFFLLCFHFVEGLTQTNEGREFWLSFMEHRNPMLNTKVVMITSRVNTSGTISAPLNGFTTTFTVQPNEVTLIELPQFAETIGSESVTPNGFEVKSNDDISVYIHQYFSFRAEATLVLPKSTVDKSYYAMSYTGFLTEGEVFPSQMLVVANDDDTNITIDLSANTRGGKRAGTRFTIQLNAGETYQVQGATQFDDLSGSFLQSDKPFSLFCGNRYTALNCFRSGRDNLIEQAFPISTWGTRFVSAPFRSNILDIFRILASEDNTVVDILSNDGSTSQYNINAGEFIEYEEKRVAFIESNQPILIAQYMNQTDCGNGVTGDPSMLYLNSVLQIRDTVTMYNSSFENIFDNYINIITRSDDLDNVFFDGQPLSVLAPNPDLAGENDEYASITLRVSTGSHTIASAGCGVIAKAYGLGDHESYAYSGGASFTKINASPIPEGGCLNDTVFFDTGLPEERYDIKWVLEGQDTIDDHQFFKIYNQLGTEDAELFIHDRCFDLFDTLSNELQITLRQSVVTDPLNHFCAGDEIQLAATDVSMATYEWTGPLEYFSEEQNPVITDVHPEMAGQYQVIGIVSGCATLPAIIDVDIKSNPQPNLGDDAIFCPKDPVITQVTPGVFEGYEWQDGSSLENLSIYAEGAYLVTVTDEFDCIGSDSIVFVQRCPTDYYIPNIFSPNGDGINDEFGLFGEDVISFNLKVFDRWGSEIFQSSDLSILWNGQYNSRLSTTGSYVWTLNIQGYDDIGETFSRLERGTITIIR